MTSKEEEEEFIRKESKLCTELKIFKDIYLSIKELLVIECINEGFIDIEVFKKKYRYEWKDDVLKSIMDFLEKHNIILIAS